MRDHRATGAIETRPKLKLKDIYNMDNESDSDLGDILSDLLANDETVENCEPTPNKPSREPDLDKRNNENQSTRVDEEQKRSVDARYIESLLKEETAKRDETGSLLRETTRKTIVNPTVSSARLEALMRDKIALTISKLNRRLNTEKADKDWVIAGVLINKSAPKTSQRGSCYSVWKITDLSEKSKDGADLATLSIDNPQRVMILGKSKDMGKCGSKKKNGEPCNSIVNIDRCRFCLYHVKQEYKKCSSRAELQAFSNTQRFSLDAAKGKSQRGKIPATSNAPEFHGVVAVRNKRLEEKDAKRLALLSAASGRSSSENVGKTARETASEGRRKSLEETIASPVSWRGPRLGIGRVGGTIDLSEPITRRQVNVAKSNAIKWVKENGQIKAKDPNKIGSSREEKAERGRKRAREPENDGDGQQAKRGNRLLSDKFKEMMSVKSIHTDLIERSYEEAKDEYFDKLEMKERMEEKMLTTYKVPCKAVTCLHCKYTTFSASDLCKEQKHPLRVVDAVKRFFKCADCANRTVSLDRIPSHSCTKCSSSKWKRAAMMDERKTDISVTPLCVRGDEETFLGSVAKHANLNLLVPENVQQTDG